jgi:uncharacterized membrane protein
MTDVTIARMLHLLAVVIWIGGVAMVTTVALPALRRGELGADRQAAFRAIQHRFVWQARSAVVIVGASGLYMVWRLDLWSRFHSLDFWWMHAMVCVWALFAVLLFVAEPFVMPRFLPRMMRARPEASFARLHRMHWVLLALSVIAILGAVAGSHGWPIL